MYLGLDLGTSGLKGVIADEVGQIHATHSESLAVSRPQSGWSEQDPADWIAAARGVLSALKAHLPAVKAIGLSGQMHGATCLDKGGDVIRPCILWNDTRAHKEAAALDAQAHLKSIFGNITFAGFTAPKVIWMRENQPENYARIAKVLLPKDYLRYWLTGELVSEMSDASGTAWLDIAARDWSDELLAASGLTRAGMPALVEGSEASGQLREALVSEFGFPSRVIIAGGAGDNAASAMGLDITKPGRAFVSLGTSGVVFAATDAFFADPASALHSFCHALPAHWHQMGVTLSATDSLNWIARQLDARPADLVDALGTEIAVSDELFLPFLGGERTPYNSATLRASFHELSHETDRKALTRAVLEGVSFSMRECLARIEQSSGKIDQLLLVGGGAQSDYWPRLLATVLNRQVLRPKDAAHIAAIGAARLAMLANEDAPAPLEITSDAFDPDQSSLAKLDDKFRRYQHAVAQSL